jgi:hypothetical protein
VAEEIFWRNSRMPLSRDDQRLLPALIWSLKPSDLSVLQAHLQEAGASQIGTAKNSGNDIFYSKLQALGLAREVPLSLDLPPEALEALKNIKTFTLTEAGKAELLSTMEIALNSGYPPSDSIVAADAVQMLKQYAAEGNAPSQSKLGLLFQDGIGVEQDHAEALKWYRKAADLGDIMAHNNIGFMYFAGFGVPKSLDEALKWFIKAADLGSTGAMDNIGEMYSRGLGVAQDYTEAFKWFRQAADRGHGPAQCKVASAYSAGQGVPQDNVQAYLWFSLGIAAGVDATKNLAAVASQMTPDQIKQGDLLASQWKPREEK